MKLANKEKQKAGKNEKLTLRDLTTKTQEREISKRLLDTPLEHKSVHSGEESDECCITKKCGHHHHEKRKTANHNKGELNVKKL